MSEGGGNRSGRPSILREPRYPMALAGLVVLFALGLVGFYQYSADKGDGLEVTMEEGDVEEEGQVWSAPLEYGDDYTRSLTMGLLGFTFLAVLTLAYGHLLRRRQRVDS